MHLNKLKKDSITLKILKRTQIKKGGNINEKLSEENLKSIENLL